MDSPVGPMSDGSGAVGTGEREKPAGEVAMPGRGRRFYTADHVQLAPTDEIISILKAEPALTGDVFAELGFWEGLRFTLWAIAHPHQNARKAAEGMKRKLIDRVCGL